MTTPAKDAFEKAIVALAAVTDRAVSRANSGEMLTQTAFGVDDTGAIHLERSGLWLITRRTQSLDALRLFVASFNRETPSSGAPPN